MGRVESGFGKGRLFENFHLTQASLKTVKSSLARAHSGRGGVPGFRTWDPCHGLRGPCTRNELLGTRVQIEAHQPQYTKKL